MYQATAVALPGAGQVIRLLVFRSSWVGQPGMWHWYNRVIGGTTTSPCTMDTHTYVVSELSANFGKTVAWQHSPSHPAWEELRSGPSANAGSLSYHRSMCVSLCEGGRPTSLIRDWELDKFEASIKNKHIPHTNLKLKLPWSKKKKMDWNIHLKVSKINIYNLHRLLYVLYSNSELNWMPFKFQLISCFRMK